MAKKKIKISELSPATSLAGFSTLGYKIVDGKKTSVQLDLSHVQTAYEKTVEATGKANEAAGKANKAATDANAQMVQMSEEVNQMVTDVRQLEATVEEQEEIRENFYSQTQAKEQARQNDEIKRQEAAAVRAAEFAKMKADLETATLDAQEQANYAKQEGDKAAGLNDDVRYLEANKLEGLAVENDLLYGVIGGELVGDGIAMPSGGGGGGGAVGSILRVKNLSGTAVTVAEGQAVVIRYSFSSLDSEDNTPTGDGTAEYFVNSIKVATETIAQGEISKDITKYLTKGINAVKLTVTDSYGASRSLNIKAEVVDVSITSTFDASQPVTGEFTFRYTPVGAMEKMIHFLVDNVEIATNTTTLTLREVSEVIPAQTHGSHMLEVYATATVNGVDIESAHLYYDLICLEEGNTTPIIASSFHPGSVQQFDTLNIPFYVYSPSSSSSEVTLWVNGVQTGTRTVDRSLQTWAYRTSVAGALAMEIKCGAVTKTFDVDVTELSIDVAAETQDLELYLSSQNRSNSDANKEEWKSGDIAAILTGFNWKTNGWVLDDNGYSCLRVGSGAKVEIPLNLFGADFRAGGKTIEFEFLVRDVYHYDTPVISCWNGNRGIKITAQDALMKSEQSEVSTVFKDGERVRISFAVQKRALNRLINIYVNGVNSQSIQYPDADNFTQAVPVGITIGGADATVDVYTIRSYSNDLNRYQLLDNYIADMDDVGRKLTVYGRNKIYDSYGSVDINALNKYIPVMTIIGDLPQYKGDKKTVRVIYTDLLHPEKSFTADGVQIDVQGTSSQYYPRKNYKLKFKNGFTMTTDGSHVDGYTLSDADCLPATVFCTKADFAESSGTHNTGIANYADWLLHQMGIMTKPQETNAVVRTTVYGEPCCMAHRPTAESESEFIGKYNFNTDKGAENTFGFGEGAESWEFCNNTSDRVLFKRSDYGEGWTDDFEARYPEDNFDFTRLKEITDWIVSCGTDVEKFKAELTLHMDKTQIVFYWLFTFIFGMVDQRAKNMFLTVYNGGLWLFILYDNDTCLGINNEGAISFKYNVEIHDILGSKAVWNGADSALWNLVEQAYPDEIKSMYYTMRQQNYLTYDKVIEFLNTRQSDKWSEAIFNEDGFFKYEKPLVDGYLDYSQSTTNPQLVKTGAYLYALQGSREMHRKWWVANRLNYLDSKFLAGAILSDTAVFRTYTPSSWAGVEPCADITLTAFSAMYLNVKWGSVTKSQRVGFNETYKMVSPAGMSFNDTETIIYGASLISSLGDLSPLYVGSVDVSKMSRLKELIVGSATEGYSNTNFTVMSVGNNKMLRKVDVRGCPNLVQPIDLSGCENIEEVLADSTGLTSVILPSAGIMKKLHLPATVTNLTIKNQPLLTDENFIIDGKDNITTIVLENVSINAFALLQECLASGNLQRIRCIGITGSTDTADILYQIAEIGGIDENGYNTDHAVLTGTFHVATIREDKFAELSGLFPELTITYDTLTLLPAVTLSFTSSQSKSLLSTKFSSGSYYQKVDNTTFVVKGEIGETFTFTFSALNHEDVTGEVTITQQEETKEFSAIYIPLRTIRVLKRNTTIFIPAATVTIGDETYTASTTGQVQIREKSSVAGTVEANDYNDGAFEFEAITDDTISTVYLDPQAVVTFTVKDNKNNLLSGAIVSAGGKQATTNSLGKCTITLKKGDYSYSVKYQSYAAKGDITVALSDLPVSVVMSLDITTMIPEENGNILMMLTGTNAVLYITSTNANYVIDWGDGETTPATETGDQRYEHAYSVDAYFQVEISNCEEITSCNGTSACLAAYWSIGDSLVKNLSFEKYFNLLYVGLVFKNDVSRMYFYDCFSGCVSLTSYADGIFDNCINAEFFGGGNTDKGGCFSECKSLENVRPNTFLKCTRARVFGGNIYRKGCFYGCKKLKNIPEDIFAGNINATSFDYCFYGSGLESVSDQLFKNNIISTGFEFCFYGTELKEIPIGLLEHVAEGANISYMFSNIKNFNSQIPAYWDLYADKNFITERCFEKLDQASNWNEVPAEWGGPFFKNKTFKLYIFNNSQWVLNQDVQINGKQLLQQSDGTYMADIDILIGYHDVIIGDLTSTINVLLNSTGVYFIEIGDTTGLYKKLLLDFSEGINEDIIILNENNSWSYDAEKGGMVVYRGTNKLNIKLFDPFCNKIHTPEMTVTYDNYGGYFGVRDLRDSSYSSYRKEGSDLTLSKGISSGSMSIIPDIKTPYTDEKYICLKKVEGTYYCPPDLPADFVPQSAPVAMTLRLKDPVYVSVPQEDWEQLLRRVSNLEKEVQESS